MSKLSEFQALSLTCQRNFLKHFLSSDLLEAYERLRNEIQPELEMLLTESEESCENVVERCVYCDDVIDDGKMMCGDSHDMPRCCLSMIQVPILNKTACIQCVTHRLDDENLLRTQLFPNDIPNDELNCPLCDERFYGFPDTIE